MTVQPESEKKLTEAEKRKQQDEADQVAPILSRR